MVAAHYNTIGSTRGKYCKTHASTEMINVVSPKCTFSGGCSKQPVYNYPHLKKGVLCKEHKTEGMTSVKYRVPAADTQYPCSEPSCTQRAIYHYRTFRIPSYCVEHKKDNMMDVTFHPCLSSDCLRRAVFSQNEIPSSCTKHADLSTMKPMFPRPNYNLLCKQKKAQCNV
jgi:hypothetical protein